MVSSPPLTNTSYLDGEDPPAIDTSLTSGIALKRHQAEPLVPALRHPRSLCCHGVSAYLSAVIVSVTTLGSATGNAAGAAADVVRYLEGRGPADHGRDPGPTPDLPAADKTTGVVGYYADSMAAPGIWMGSGLTGVRMEGMIDPAQLHAVLLGQNPLTGDQLMTANGSAQRAHGDHIRAALRGPDEALLTLVEAAETLGVSSSYLRQQASATHKARALQARQRDAGQELAPLPSSHLDATQAGPGAPWQVSRGELRRFTAERSAPPVVIGYDLTFSAPKSVSVLWATTTPAQRVVIEAALTEAVRVGIDYLEENAAHVRVSVRSDDGTGRRLERQPATGLVAAAYLHDTSRALDPQLHFHVVAANMGEGPDGAVRALDGRSLYLHAKTAGYLSAAELRNRLSRELGVAWDPASRGVADIDGVPRAAILEMSQRSRQMDDHIQAMEEHKPTSARGRQVAAYDTRAAKDTAVDPDSLRPSWEQRLAGVGFDRAAIDACYGRQRAPQLVDSVDREELFRLMHGADGVTEYSSTFDRRDVLQFVAQWAGDRLSAPEIEELADSWLTGPEIVRLEPDRHDARTGDAIRRADGRTVPAIALDDLYTTRAILAMEEVITLGYQAGRSAGVATVDPGVVERVLAERPHFGPDQADMVRAVTTSGQRIQLIRGDAGAGKTTALEAAARAWEAAGYDVIGCAVQGTASEIVADNVKVPSATMASLLARVQMGDAGIGPNTVVLVDECSTLGNRDLHRLVRALEETGAAARLAGDPRQHTAVAAGGAWRRLLEQYPDDVPVVAKVWRQSGKEMGDVREALARWRADDVEGAIDILRRHGRVVEHADRDQFLTAIVDEWYDDRLRRQADPDLEPSSAMTQFHRDRRDINLLARQRLVEDGTLSGPVLHAGDLEFQRGDEVIALEQDRDLRPEGAKRRRDFVHTAERGVVVEVRLPRRDDPGSVVVDFDTRGQVVVPMEYLTRRLDRGVHGALAHSYALTTHAAQGATFAASRSGHTETADPKAVYTAITRPTDDLTLHTFPSAATDPAAEEHPQMPRLVGDADVMAAFTRNMKSDRDELLAGEIDPQATRVAALLSDNDLPSLDRLVASGGPDTALAQRARRQRAQAIACEARLHPPADLVARLGTRPSSGPARAPWDDAVGQVALYRARYAPALVPDGPYVTWALGSIPAHPAHLAAYQAAGRALLEAEQAGLTQRRPAELAAERAQLRAAMAPPSDEARREARLMHREAEASLVEATAEERKAGRALDAAEHPVLRKPNAKRVHAAEAEHTAAAAAVLTAQADLRRCTERVAALDPNAVAEARIPLQQRLARIDGAIAEKVRDAVASPAPYLSSALGPRPSDPDQRQRWNEAARQIETWRHGELGLGPADGALAPDGISAALGPPPTDPGDALRRELAVRQLPIEFQAHRTIDRAIEGPALTLD